MNGKPKISSGNRSQPGQFCPVCQHRVYNLETHYQTEEHKRHLRHSKVELWQDDWPTEEGLWWFYGWCFGKEGLGKDREPKLCLVEISGPLGSGSFIYVTNGHFLHKAEGITGKWQRTNSPELPNLKEVPNDKD